MIGILTRADGMRQPPLRTDHRSRCRGGASVSVVVVAHIRPLPEHLDAVREAFLETLPAVHEEPGCEL
jgi:hypothetical protein